MSIRNFYKKIIISIFKKYYGKIEIDSNFFKKKKYINKNFFYYFYEIDYGRVFTNTNDVAYLKNNKIIKGASLQIRNTGYNDNILRNVVFKTGTPKKHTFVNAKVYSILTGIESNNNYFHWFFDSLPRLLLIKKFYKVEKNDFFLVNNLKHNFQRESLKKLGVKNILNAYELKHIKAKKIITIDFHRKHTDVPQWFVNDLRSYLLKNHKLKKKSAKKIFIDRSNTSSKTRDVYNKQELINFLKKKNFYIIDPSNLSFDKEIELFYNAKIVIGLYGAGLTNLIFCRKNCKVVELKKIKTNKLYENIAKKIGLKFNSLGCKGINNNYSNRNFDGSIIVDINKLSSLIS